MDTGPMMKISTYTSALAAALALTLAGCAAPPTAPAVAASAGMAPTTSVAEADARLAEVARRRQVAEALYADSERECYPRFFVSRCLDQAREQRRATLAGLRAIEVEASHFKRVESVERRDAALAERQKQDERDAAARAALPPKKASATPAEAAPAKAKAKAESIEKRQAAREAKEQRRTAQEAAGAGERAANVAAFKRKQQEAAERQRAVAEKLAAKAAKEAQAAKPAPQPEAAGK